MQLINLQQRNLLKVQSFAAIARMADRNGDDDGDPPPTGGLAIHLRDLRFDPPVIADALARWAA